MVLGGGTMFTVGAFWFIPAWQRVAAITLFGLFLYASVRLPTG